MSFFVFIQQYNDVALLALRLAVGAIFMVHGAQKFALRQAKPSPQLPADLLKKLQFLAIVEPLGGLAVAAGFLTQLAAVGLGVIMLGALWHKLVLWKFPFAGQDKTGWELDLLILAACVTLAVAGAGSISLGQMLWGV